MIKKHLTFGVVAAIMLAVVIAVLNLYIPRTCDFSFEDYNGYIYPDDPIFTSGIDIYRGAVDNKWTAAKVGAEFFNEVYGKTMRPITVGYDAKNDMWHIYGYFRHRRHKKGGPAHIIINASDGKLIAVWHGN